MAYFKYFPQLEILNRTKNETSSDETHIVTNLFKRVKIREDILGAVSAFEDYKIDPGERPDSIAEAYYGDPELDWVVLLSNNITNLENQWPLDPVAFKRYLDEKYPNQEELNAIAYYETKEIRDDFNRLVFPAGLKVDEAFYNAPVYVPIDGNPPGITFPPIYVSGTDAQINPIIGAGNSIVGGFIVNPGAGYTEVPQVTLSAPAPTSSASASVSMNQFAVTGIATFNPGLGYNFVPTVVIESPIQSVAAAATCELGVGNNFDRVAAITDLTPGIGYGITAPAVTFSKSPNFMGGSYVQQSIINLGNDIEGAFLSADGGKLYTASLTGTNQIKAFNVSNAYEATTIFAVNDLDVSADFTFTTGVEMNPTGSKLFVSGGQASTYKIAEYVLSTPHNLNTATKNSELIVTEPSAIRFNNDGTLLYQITGQILKVYTLSTPYQITSVNTLFNVPEVNLNTLIGAGLDFTGFTIKSDGSKMFVTDETTTSLYELDFGFPYNIQTLTYAKTFNVSSQANEPVDVYLAENEEKFLVFDGASNRAKEYLMTTRAEGIALIDGAGKVSQVQITRTGSGYTAAPTITIGQPFPAVTATAALTMDAGQIDTLTITNAGFGYTFTPAITISPAQEFRQGTFEVVLNDEPDRGIGTIRMIDGGANYVNSPVFTIGPAPDIQRVFVDDFYSQIGRTWKWSGTTWEEKISQEFRYLESVGGRIRSIPGRDMATPVTNYEVEVQENDAKSVITLIKPEFLSAVLAELKTLMKYDPETENFVNDKLKRTYNPKLTGI